MVLLSRRRFRGPLSAVLTGLLLAGAGCRGPSEPPAELVGPWQGDARVIVSWCAQERLTLELEIDAAGGVRGRVGDARLTHGRLCRNRGELGRRLELATDWIVLGDLDGPLVASDDIVRAGVKIPFDLVAGELRGGLHSTGLHVGPPGVMVFSAAGLVLRRP